MSAIARVPRAARWRPTPFVAGSIGVHAAALVTLAAAPQAWPWALAAVAADQAVLTTLGLWPRSTWLGPNLTRLPPASARRGEIALTFDDGPDPEVTPRVLEILEAAGVHATFFCIAANAARHPELVRAIARRGHRVENHSSAHRAGFALLGPAGIRREIGAAQATLGALAGAAPRFFRAPAGLRNPLLDPVLHGLGLRLATWTRRGFDTRRGDAARVTASLTGGLAAGDILLLHDGHCARTGGGVPVVLEVLPRLLAAAQALRLRPVTLERAVAA